MCVSLKCCEIQHSTKCFCALFCIAWADRKLELLKVWKYRVCFKKKNERNFVGSCDSLYSIRKCRSAMPRACYLVFLHILPLEEEWFRLQQAFLLELQSIVFHCLCEVLGHLPSHPKKPRDHRPVRRSFCCRRVPSCRQGLLGSLTDAPRESWQEGDKLCTEQQPEGTATGILLICKSPRFAW